MCQSKPAYFHMMAKPSSFHCNIKCEYCFYLEKEQVLTHNVDLMTDETLRTYTKNYIESHSGDHVDFAWQRQLHQNSMKTLVLIVFFNNLNQLFFADRF